MPKGGRKALPIDRYYQRASGGNRANPFPYPLQIRRATCEQVIDSNSVQLANDPAGFGGAALSVPCEIGDVAIKSGVDEASVVDWLDSWFADHTGGGIKMPLMVFYWAQNPAGTAHENANYAGWVFDWSMMNNPLASVQRCMVSEGLAEWVGEEPHGYPFQD